MKNSLLPLLLIFVLISFLSCEVDLPNTIQEVEPSNTSQQVDLPTVPNCCANPPLTETVGTGKVYIPNIFTPSNQDGINDVFGVFVDNNIEEVESLEIFSSNGNLVFSEMNIQPIELGLLWDGKVDGSIPRAMYDVRLTVVSSDGITASFNHKVCSFYCLEDESKEPIFNALSECRFGTQHNGLGEVDENAPAYDEFDCLE